MYGMEISKKSKYTNRGLSAKDEEEIEAQNIKIKNKYKNQACKYLGFWTALDGNWEKQKRKVKEKHQNTINLLAGGSIDARIKGKLINIIANTPLEYGFHSVPYSREELDELTVKNKTALKRI